MGVWENFGDLEFEKNVVSYILVWIWSVIWLSIGFPVLCRRTVHGSISWSTVYSLNSSVAGHEWLWWLSRHDLLPLQYHLQELTNECRSCAVPLEWLFWSRLENCYIITVTLINASIWNIFVPFLIFYGFMEFKTWRGKLIITFNCRNMRINKCCSKAFL